MKTRKLNFLITGALLLAMVGIALWAAPYARALAAPKAQTTLPTMGALVEATCIEDTTILPGTQTCELWAKTGSLSLPDGGAVPVWGFAATVDGAALVPGPVIRVTEGQTLVINLHNELAEPVSLAFPGFAGVSDTTGAATGGTFTYTLANLPAGTFLYEAGMTEGGARQVSMGLSGPMVVESTQAPTWSQEVILFLNEVDPSFNADPINYSLIRFKPRYWLMNGKAFPQTGAVTVSPASTVLMRYLNGGVDFYSIGLLGLNQQVIAADGQPVPLTYGATVPALAPGQTLETLVNIPAGAQDGTLFTLYNGSLLQHNNNQRLADMRAAFGGMLAFLQVTGGTTPAGQGPVTTGVTVTPVKSNGTADLTLAATITDDNTTVTQFEYFMDAISADGTGTLFVVETPATSVGITQIIAAADLAVLSSGTHTLYVHGMDADGNWGPPSSAVFTLDKAGPVITGTGLSPNPTNGAVDVTVNATASDTSTGNSNVMAAEYRLDGGAWTPMTVSPVGGATAGLSAILPAGSVTGEGPHLVEVQALDGLGNWSLTPGSATLNLDQTGPQVLTSSLNPNSIDLSQPLPASVRLTASLQDLGIVQSSLVNAEGFIDTAGAPGTGFALYPSDGLFDEPVEDVYYNIPGSKFATLTAGTHYVLVVGKDKAGNWGPAGSAAITITTAVPDTTGPTMSVLAVNPNPTTAKQTVTITATATDAQSNIAGVVWFQGTNPAKAKLNNMTPVDGAFDSLSEAATATTSFTKAGSYQISVRAYDTAGNWGPVLTITLVVNR